MEPLRVHQNMPSEAEKQSLEQQLDDLSTMLSVWRSRRSSRKTNRNRQHFDSQLAMFDRISESTDVLLSNCPPTMKHKAKRLKMQVLLSCEVLVSEMMADLDPLFKCIERMKTMRVEVFCLSSSSSLREIEREKCTVCLEEFGVSGMDAKVTECGHKFHESCIFKWLQSSGCCPVCRQQLL